MNTLTAAIVIADPYGARLVQALEQDSRCDDWTMLACHVDDTLPKATVYITSSATVDVVHRYAGTSPVGVIVGNRPDPQRLATWQQAGIVLLTGSVPSCVSTWLGTIVAAQAGTTEDWSWVDSDAGNLPTLGADSHDVGDRSVRARDQVFSTAAEVGSSRNNLADGQGHSLAVYSSGGGEGKTTMAVYLATIAAQKRHHVGLVELDEEQRSILTYWNQQIRQGGLDSIPPHVWTDPSALAAMFEVIAVPVHARLRVLPMAGTLTGLQYGRDHASQAVSFLLDWAKAQWTWTFVDLPARLHDASVLSALKAVDHIVWVIEPTETRLDSSRGQLDLLEQLGADGQQIIRKIGLVVNKVEKHRAARLDPASLADSLGLPLWGTVPSDSVKYFSGINQHRVDPTPDWQRIAAALNIMGPDADAKLADTASVRRPWWKRRPHGSSERSLHS